MNLSFVTKTFNRSVQASPIFAITFLCEMQACLYVNKLYNTHIYKKNNTCTSFTYR